jgi:hypothetical protein
MGQTIIQKAAKVNWALGLLKAFFLVVSTATSGYAVADTVVGWFGNGDGAWLDWAIRIAVYAACAFIDFLVIDYLFTVGYYSYKKAKIEKGERIEAKMAYGTMLFIGVCGIIISGSTSYLGSEMLGAKFTPKVSTKEIKDANREEAQALAPYRGRRDSLEKELKVAIDRGAEPYAKCAKKGNTWCKQQIDSVSQAQTKAFASRLKEASKELETAQASMAGTFALIKETAATSVQNQAKAENAKAWAGYILVRLFGLASVLISVLIIVTMVNAELAVTTTPPASALRDEDDPFAKLLGGNGSKNRQSPKPHAGNGQGQRSPQPQNHFDLN